MVVGKSAEEESKVRVLELRELRGDWEGKCSEMGREAAMPRHDPATWNSLRGELAGVEAVDRVVVMTFVAGPVSPRAGKDGLGWKGRDVWQQAQFCERL